MTDIIPVTRVGYVPQIGDRLFYKLNARDFTPCTILGQVVNNGRINIQINNAHGIITEVSIWNIYGTF